MQRFMGHLGISSTEQPNKEIFMEFSPFIIAVLGMLFPFGILAIIFGFESKSEARFHATLQRLLESGQPLDETLIEGIPGYKKKYPRNDIRSGLITGGTGLGITLLGFVALGSWVYGAGLLVLCIGGGIFVYGIIDARQNRIESD